MPKKYAQIRERIREIFQRHRRRYGYRRITITLLFKIVLLQHIYGVPSLRQTLHEVQMNIGSSITRISIPW